MFLKEFGLTEVQTSAKKVFDAADLEPIVLTRRGKSGYILLSKEAYIDLVNKARDNDAI